MGRPAELSCPARRSRLGERQLGLNLGHPGESTCEMGTSGLVKQASNCMYWTPLPSGSCSPGNVRSREMPALVKMAEIFQKIRISRVS